MNGKHSIMENDLIVEPFNGIGDQLEDVIYGCVAARILQDAGQYGARCCVRWGKFVHINSYGRCYYDLELFDFSKWGDVMSIFDYTKGQKDSWENGVVFRAPTMLAVYEWLKTRFEGVLYHQLVHYYEMYVSMIKPAACLERAIVRKSKGVLLMGIYVQSPSKRDGRQAYHDFLRVLDRMYGDIKMRMSKHTFVQCYVCHSGRAEDEQYALKIKKHIPSMSFVAPKPSTTPHAHGCQQVIELFSLSQCHIIYPCIVGAQASICRIAACMGEKSEVWKEDYLATPIP